MEIRTWKLRSSGMSLSAGLDFQNQHHNEPNESEWIVSTCLVSGVVLDSWKSTKVSSSCPRLRAEWPWEQENHHHHHHHCIIDHSSSSLHHWSSSLPLAKLKFALRFLRFRRRFWQRLGSDSVLLHGTYYSRNCKNRYKYVKHSNTAPSSRDLVTNKQLIMFHLFFEKPCFTSQNPWNLMNLASKSSSLVRSKCCNCRSTPGGQSFPCWKGPVPCRILHITSVVMWSPPWKIISGLQQLHRVTVDPWREPRLLKIPVWKRSGKLWKPMDLIVTFMTLMKLKRTWWTWWNRWTAVGQYAVYNRSI